MQNLIKRGIYETVISALRCDGGIDSGDIYLKRPISLGLGSAEEIFIRAADVVKEMIVEIIEKDIRPIPQTGEVTAFKRRTPEQSRIENISSLIELYDHIRMLDADGYPPAFIEHENIRMEFSRVSMTHNGLEAHVSLKIMSPE